MSRTLAIAAAGTLLLAAAACTRNADKTAQAPPPPPPPAAAPAPQPAAIADVKIGTAPSADAAMVETKQQFAPGEPIQLSMDIHGADTGTTVTTYWYGPEDHRLGYETKTVAPDQQQLRFTQDNTADWKEGQYRAEVWIGDRKAQEQSFQIAKG